MHLLRPRTGIRATIGRWASAGLLVLGTAACGSSSESSGSATTTTAAAVLVPPLTGTPTLVAPDAAWALLSSATPPVLVDVRTPEEFTAGHLAGALNIDLQAATFERDVSALDRSATYLVYCRSGNRSATATALMGQLGFDEVYELQDGIVAWQAAGFPVTT